MNFVPEKGARFFSQFTSSFQGCHLSNGQRFHEGLTTLKVEKKGIFHLARFRARRIHSSIVSPGPSWRKLRRFGGGMGENPSIAEKSV